MTAKATGYSASTLDRAERVAAAAEDEDAPEPVRQVAREALAQMNTTGPERAVRAPVPPGVAVQKKDAEPREQVYHPP